VSIAAGASLVVWLGGEEGAGKFWQSDDLAIIDFGFDY
jgi:hypothetical protein